MMAFVDAARRALASSLTFTAPDSTMYATRAVITITILALLSACAPQDAANTADSGGAAPAGGQASVKDDVSQPDVVKVAVGSKDHTTLVAALQAADLVNSLANAGPFTVFAPTNAAFDKLPKGTVDDLLKPENKSKLAGILQHHVTTSALEIDFFQDGMPVSMADGGREMVSRKDGAVFIGGANVVASVRASNGWVHVIDAVLVPAAK